MTNDKKWPLTDRLADIVKMYTTQDEKHNDLHWGNCLVMLSRFEIAELMEFISAQIERKTEKEVWRMDTGDFMDFRDDVFERLKWLKT